MKHDNLVPLLESSRKLMEQENRLLLNTTQQLNAGYSDILKSNLGHQLCQNIAMDTADEIVRYYIGPDFGISATHLADRIIHFSYDNDDDQMQNSQHLKNMVASMNDREMSAFQNSFAKFKAEDDRANRSPEGKLFEKEANVYNGNVYKEYKDKKVIEKGKADYRNSNDHQGKDELTGREQQRAEVDHVSPVASASYHAKYFTKDGVEKLKLFYNSPDNFQMLEKSANASKGDARVYGYKNGLLTHQQVKDMKQSFKAQESAKYTPEELNDPQIKKDIKGKTDEFEKSLDITHRATPEQVAQATVDKWESAKGSTRENLIKSGHLDENGKVPASVQKEMKDRITKSQNKESITKLKGLNRKEVAGDAKKETRAAMWKIMTGQLVYYALPPTVYEMKEITQKKNCTLKTVWKKLKEACGRIQKYVLSKIKAIFGNVIFQSCQKFIKSFFDIVILMMKATVKRVMKIVKSVVLSLVQCVKVLGNKNASKREKADSITKILGTTMATVALEVIFEWMEKQFGIPDAIAEPLQVIVTIVVTNILLVALEEVDLFNLKHGFIVANIEALTQKQLEDYTETCATLRQAQEIEMQNFLDHIRVEVIEIQVRIKNVNLYEDDVSGTLGRVSEMFRMGIDFDQEWDKFTGNSRYNVASVS